MRLPRPSMRNQRRTTRAMQLVLLGLVGYGILAGQPKPFTNGGIGLLVTFLPGYARNGNLALDPGLTLWITSAVFLHTLGSPGSQPNRPLGSAQAGTVAHHGCGRGHHHSRTIDLTTKRLTSANASSSCTSRRGALQWRPGNCSSSPSISLPPNGVTMSLANYGPDDSVRVRVQPLGALLVAAFGQAHLADVAETLRERLSLSTDAGCVTGFDGQEAPREAVCHPQRFATVVVERVRSLSGKMFDATLLRRCNVVEQHTRVMIRNDLDDIAFAERDRPEIQPGYRSRVSLFRREDESRYTGGSLSTTSESSASVQRQMPRSKPPHRRMSPVSSSTRRAGRYPGCTGVERPLPGRPRHRRHCVGQRCACLRRRGDGRHETGGRTAAAAAEKTASVVSAPVERTESALRDAVSGIESRAEANEIAVLLADDGTVQWSRDAVSAVVSGLDETCRVEDFYDADRALPETPADVGIYSGSGKPREPVPSGSPARTTTSISSARVRTAGRHRVGSRSSCYETSRDRSA